jgi:hypothetical protein
MCVLDGVSVSTGSDVLVAEDPQTQFPSRLYRYFSLSYSIPYSVSCTE